MWMWCGWARGWDGLQDGGGGRSGGTSLRSTGRHVNSSQSSLIIPTSRSICRKLRGKVFLFLILQYLPWPVARWSTTLRSAPQCSLEPRISKVSRIFTVVSTPNILSQSSPSKPGGLAGIFSGDFSKAP